MGTRNLTTVIKNGEFKVAQYGQWDGYPTGQGQKIVEFLLKNDLKKFNELIDNVKFVDDVIADKLWQQRKGKQFSRDIGAEILPLIVSGVTDLYNNLSFASDSLFCEYAYVVDLDNNMLEVYQGFNDSGIVEGVFQEFEKKDNASTDKYYPVTLIFSIPFSELDKNIMKDLEKYLNSLEDF